LRQQKYIIFISETKQETSQYKGVSWHKENGQWRAILTLKRNIQKYGGYFKDELDAAKRVNQLCEELEIPLRNPSIASNFKIHFCLTIFEQNDIIEHGYFKIRETCRFFMFF
jgi:hypothetical protein